MKLSLNIKPDLHCELFTTFSLDDSDNVPRPHAVKCFN